jgi:transcriptional regulator with XRE-family HTH domain
MTGKTEDVAAFEERLRREIEAYHASALVYTAVKLGLPDTMGERAWTAEELAAALGISAPHLHRFLRGLVTLGICEELAEERFELTPRGALLRGDSASCLDKKVRIIVEQYWRPWAELVSCLKTGEPSFDHVFGKPVGEWRRHHAEQGAAFDAYLAGETLARGDLIAGTLDLGRVATVADIGGGYGALLAALLRAHPPLRGILFDQPHTLAGAKAFLKLLGVGGRVTFVGGDVLAEIPVEADLYLLKGVVQQHDDAHAQTILDNCRNAMPENARVVIIERLSPERAADDPAAVMLDLHMMAITGGKMRNLAAFEALIAAADLAVSRVTPTTSGLTVIEAVRG